MSIEHAHSNVIDAIYKESGGISFNRLANALKGKVSRVKLLETLKDLLEEGILEVERDEKHKQKKIFKLRSEMKRKLEEINEIERSLMDDLSNLHLIFKKYCEVARDIRNETIKKYIEFKLNSLISKLFHSFSR